MAASRTVSMFLEYRTRRNVSWMALRTAAEQPPSSVGRPSRSWSYDWLPFPTITDTYGNDLCEEDREVKHTPPAGGSQSLVSIVSERRETTRDGERWWRRWMNILGWFWSYLSSRFCPLIFQSGCTKGRNTHAWCSFEITRNKKHLVFHIVRLEEEQKRSYRASLTSWLLPLGYVSTRIPSPMKWFMFPNTGPEETDRCRNNRLRRKKNQWDSEFRGRNYFSTQKQ